MSLFKDDDENLLVNKNNTVADNRGGDYVVVHPEEYQGTEDVAIKVIEQ